LTGQPTILRLKTFLDRLAAEGSSSGGIFKTHPDFREGGERQDGLIEKAADTQPCKKDDLFQQSDPVGFTDSHLPSSILQLITDKVERPLAHT
jgi:hypothetical protein